MASDSSSGFRPGALHISLQILKTQPRGRRKGAHEETRAWDSSKQEMGEVYVTLLCSSPCICRLSRAHILRETSTKLQRMLTHLFALINPASVGLQVLAVVFLTSVDSLLCPADIFSLPTVSFPGLLSQADCSLLPSFVNWSLCLLSDLPSLLHFRSRGRSRPQSLCAGFAPKQTKRSSEWLQHKRKRIATHRITLA